MNNPFIIDFRKAQNHKDLAKYIGLDEELLNLAISIDKQSNLYRKHLIPKRGKTLKGGFREVWEVTDEALADAYKAFSRRFELFIRDIDVKYPHLASYGYVRGRNILENAKNHCGAALLLRADLVSFFPSISSNRIHKILLKYGIQDKVAEIITRFVTIDDKLPLGLHTSPMFANLACLGLDEKLARLAKQYNCQYTRYADDISISGDELPSKTELIDIFQSEGFKFSEKKFRIIKRGQAQYVTGLSVSNPIRPHAPRSLKKRLRQELYYCNKFGIVNHLRRVGRETPQGGVNRIDGTVSYVSFLEKESLPELKMFWQSLLDREGRKPSYSPIIDRKHVYATFYIDESEIDYNGKKILCLALVKIEGKINNTTRLLLGMLHDEYLKNPFSGGRKKNIAKKMLHFSDANYKLRLDYINTIVDIPLKSYIIYSELPSSDMYEELYLTLVKRLIKHRLMGCDGGSVNVIFEENSRVNQNKLINVINTIYDQLAVCNDRRPFAHPTIQPKGSKKEELCLSIADFLLGFFAKYAKLTNEEGSDKEMTQINFEQLRDKYRLIIDVDKNIIYSRKRPFVGFK
jgi:RNA-directed DNA polymerase